EALAYDVAVRGARASACAGPRLAHQRTDLLQRVRQFRLPPEDDTPAAPPAPHCFRNAGMVNTEFGSVSAPRRPRRWANDRMEGLEDPPGTSSTRPKPSRLSTQACAAAAPAIPGPHAESMVAAVDPIGPSKVRARVGEQFGEVGPGYLRVYASAGTLIRARSPTGRASLRATIPTRPMRST